LATVGKIIFAYIYIGKTLKIFFSRTTRPISIIKLGTNHPQTKGISVCWISSKGDNHKNVKKKKNRER
jgi:hypothetical protein